MLRIFNLILILMLFVSCAHLSTPSYRLELKGEKGGIQRSHIEISRENYFYQNNELSSKKIRKLSLKVQSKIKQVDTEGNIWVENKTYEKKGKEYLHALGYPELNESIELKLTPSGHVLHAKGFEEGSIFYVPPVFLPSKAVNINESWEKTFNWTATGQPVGLKTTVRCKLLNLEKWNDKDVFRIQMTATSQFNAEVKDIEYTSHSKGYFLWDNKNATVLYAESQGLDHIQYLSDKNSTQTKTQFISRMLR